MKEEDFAASIELKLKKDLSREYANLEQLKVVYSSSYEEIASTAEKDVKERLEKEYKYKYDALTDGHTNMRKKVYCHKDLLKYLRTVKNEGKAEVINSIRCPYISNLTINEYVDEFLRMQDFKCADCQRYK